MKIAPDRLNKQALTLEIAQSEIRIAVKDAGFSKYNRADLDRKVRAIIMRALAELKTPSLKRTAYVSLVQFYQAERNVIESMIASGRLMVYAALTKLVEKKTNVPKAEQTLASSNMSLSKAREVIKTTTYYSEEEKVEILNYASVLNKYHDTYMKENIRPFVDKLAETEALDPETPEYFQRRETLRQKAEREVRYQAQRDQIDGFKAKGTKLVICSAHADCSERCRPWQGRVYSLDGSSGKTDDGRTYVPLEEATEIFTKNGKWTNGLLGFNCRHYLVEYSPGREFPTASRETEAKQYKITQQQRALERNVRKWRIEAEMNKGVNPARYKEARQKAKEWNARYEAFSKKHRRAYYPSRVKLL